jgi:ubiquinone/menaquinone biosynthesis C-methylase UbiE
VIARALGQRFARVATNAVVARPQLWRLFRGPIRLQFDRLAPLWDDVRDPMHLESFEQALGLVTTPPRRALDVGTGTGAGAFAIAHRFPDAEVVGVDLSEPMLAEARLKTPADVEARVRFERADAARLPFDDASFDLVALANMIPFFDELERVVAPGGWVVFGFSAGPETPIYVEPERLRRELAARGFADFADVEAGRGTAFAARKGGASA